MKNKIISLLLILLISLSLFGCNKQEKPAATDTTETQPTTSFVELEGFDRVDPEVLDFTMDLYSSVKLTKGYEALKTDTQRLCYRLIEENIFYISQEQKDGVYSINPVSVETTSFSEEEFHLIISAFTYDHPEIFWIDNSFSYYTTAGTVHLLLNSQMSAEEVTASAGQMKAEIREIFSGMPGNLSQFDRELFVHDRFAQSCEYAELSEEIKKTSRVYTSLGGIVDGVAVCEGYTRSVQLLLSLTGVESYYVYGRGNNELHMWNCVRLGDNWYYLDVTWDDKEDSGVVYDYFNITTEQALDSRTIAPLYDELTPREICGSDTESAVNFNIFIPQCDSDNMSFYAHNSITVTGFDDENLSAIAQGIAQAAQTDREAVYLYIDPYYTDFETAKEYLFSGDYLIFECISRANGLLENVVVSDEAVETEESEELCILTIYLEYR